MSDQREQLERLLSERADDALTAEQLAELERALAGDVELARKAQAYERLHVLLDGWRTLPGNIDWQNLTARIRRDVGEEAVTATSAKIDDLVNDSYGPLPDVDWTQLQSRISAAVRSDVAARHGAAPRMTRRSWSRTAKRIVAVGAPLAVAAVIALAIWMPRTSLPVAQVAPTPKSLIVVSFETPHPTGKVNVAFDQKPNEGRDAESGTNGAAVANGPSHAVPRERVEETVLY
jgi:hypothetical protein